MKHNDDKNLEMFVRFANLIKAVDLDLHDDCWEQVHNEFKNK